jgi:hypothetical protein
MGYSRRMPRIAAAIFALELLGMAQSGTAAETDGYIDCRAKGSPIVPPGLRQAIVAAVGPRTGKPNFFADNVVVVAPIDDNDGRSDWLAYIAGPGVCGSGGCNAYLFQRNTVKGYRSFGRILPARLPIRVLDSVHKGRRDLSIPVSGGGVTQAYSGVIPFDGRRYAGNPTLANIRHVPPDSGGIVIGLPGQSTRQCRLR